MTIDAGRRLGPYEILEPLGAGGMGEVYRARDTRLERDVAVKVLPMAIADNEQLRARFEREAKTISQLSHPHICTLHDVGSDDGVEFLVMEYLEGESLAEDLARGPLSLDLCLRYGIQIASALDRAHRAGVIHRDLKPANVMITKSGAKLLDFGLARMAREAAEPAEGLTNLPTAQKNLTEEGTILGTVQYMAPEQLEGRTADPRTDIFAFGALLFEMLTGRRVFQGKSRVSLMAAILEHEPPSIASIQPMSPPALERLVRTCLEKDPDDRWQTAHDVELQLRWIEEGGSDVGLPAQTASKRRGRERLAWVIAALGTIATIALTALWLESRQEPRLARFSISPPPGLSITVNEGLAISPDGNRLVFAGLEGAGPTRLYLREMNQIEARPLGGTERGEFPFWSPDGREIAFFSDGTLKRMSVFGGPTQTICNAPAPRGGSWNDDGTIVFGSGSEGGRGVLSKVPARGGTPVEISVLDEERGELSHRWPWFLPDGEHLLFLSQTAEGGSRDDQSTIEVLSIKTGERTRLLFANSSVQFVGTGHILFWQQGNLIAQRFDPDGLEVLGDPLPIAERVRYSGLERAGFTASNEGTLLYQSRVVIESQLTLFDREGSRLGTVGPASRDIATPAFSFDGSRLAYSLDGDIWIRDLARGSDMRLTFDSADEYDPVWLPGDEWIVFSSERRVFRKRSSGIGEPELLLGSDGSGEAYSVSADGRYLFIHQEGIATQVDVARLDTLDGTVETIVNTPSLDVTPYPSPDGKWLAVTTMETGRPEIYVHRLENPGGRWQLSVDGGVHPLWSPDGSTIHYLSLEDRVMVVTVETGSSFQAGTPAETIPIQAARTRSKPYDISRDGSRIVINTVAGNPSEEPDVTVVLNWDRLLEQ